MDNKFKTDTTIMKIDQVIKELNSGEITVDVTYQRNEVWTDDKRQAFINSCYRGIVPSPLIFNRHYDTGKLSCIDGIQRMSAIRKFKNNEIGFEYNNEKIYYDSLPDISEPNNRILTNIEKQDNFLMVRLPVVEYKNLEYSEEIDIFNRIQNGLTLKTGELIASLISNQDIAILFNDYCEKKKHLFESFKKVNRKEHLLFISNIMFMINENKLCKMTCAQKVKFFNSLNTVQSINNLIKKIDKLIEFSLSNLFTSNKYFKKMSDMHKLVYIYYIYKTYGDKYVLTQYQIDMLNYGISKTYTTCQEDDIPNKTNEKTCNKIYKIFCAFTEDISDD